MKRFYTKKAILLIAILMSFYSLFSQEAGTYVEDELILWLEEDVDASIFIEEYANMIQIKESISNNFNIWLLSYTPSEGRINDINSIKQDERVKHLQNNHRVEARGFTPNDPQYVGNNQWHINHINMPDAWDNYTTGGPTVDGDEIVIAVVDDGLNYNHEDIKVWTNDDEVYPPNRLSQADLDGNGYLSDYYGWNAIDEDGWIYDYASHGTKVSGLAGAIGNNAKGITGINMDVSIMIVHAWIGTSAQVIKGYDYIYSMRKLYNDTDGEKGAFIVVTNSSFGVPYKWPSQESAWCEMYNKLGEVGILSVGSTDNWNFDVDSLGDIPSTCPSNHLIAVTNTIQNDSKYVSGGGTPGAAYGTTSIDIGAPGVNMVSTNSQLPSPAATNLYASSDGTSYSAPLVSGAISLMYAAACEELIHAYKEDPEAIALKMRNFLLDGAAFIPALTPYVDGSRRLDVLGALDQMYNNSMSVLDIPTNNSDGEFLSSTTHPPIEEGIIRYGDPSLTSLVESGAEVVMEADQGITLREGVVIENGADFWAYINPFAKCTEQVFRKKSNSSENLLDEELVLEETQFKVYPNPTNGQFNIAIRKIAGLEDNVQIRVNTIRGKLMYDRQFGQIDNTTIPIDLSDLPNGVYILSVQNGSNIEQQKIVKQ